MCALSKPDIPAFARSDTLNHPSTQRIARMSSRTTLHDLKSLVCSFHSLVVIDTVEEERVSSMLVSIARELRLPLFEWSVIHGLSRFPEETAIHGTSEPLGLLGHLESVDIAEKIHRSGHEEVWTVHSDSELGMVQTGIVNDSRNAKARRPARDYRRAFFRQPTGAGVRLSLHIC